MRTQDSARRAGGMGYNSVKRAGALQGQVQGLHSWQALTFKVGGTRWTEWKKMLSDETSSKEQKQYDVLYTWNPKKGGTNELAYKTEVESQV